MIFLYHQNTDTTVTYEELLQKINFSKGQTTIFIDEKKPIDFFVKLIVNFINDVDTVIFDSELSESFKNKIISEKEKNINFLIDKTVYGSFDDVLAKILKSKSNIGIFTSGTTGEPKLVTHSVAKFNNMARVSSKYNNNIWAFVYNMTHMAGLQVFFQIILNKNPLIYLFQCNRNQFIETAKKFKITNISATPTFYRLLSPFTFQINTIKKCTLGGEKSNNSLLESLQSIFPNATIYNIYASTEAGSLFVSKGEVFKVIDALKDKVKFHNNEIIIHSSLLGNFSKQEWFQTGDIVEFIQGSNTEFKIVSRANSIINIGGNRVNLQDVELAILEVDGVSNALVYTIDNSVLGKVIKAEIVSSTAYTSKEFKQKLRKKLESFKIPTSIKFVDSLKTSRTGKLERVKNN